MKRLYNVKEVANMLSLSASCIYKKAERGEIGSIKIGTALRFSETNINEFIDKCTNPNGNDSKQTSNHNRFDMPDNI